jgi:hypothetical protein
MHNSTNNQRTKKIDRPIVHCIGRSNTIDHVVVVVVVVVRTCFDASDGDARRAAPHRVHVEALGATLYDVAVDRSFDSFD